MTPTTLKIHDILSQRALVTRESARPIRDALLSSSITEEIALDFSGVDAVTPSFIDELFTLLGISMESGHKVRLTIVNPPTRLSGKFTAVARAHGMASEELEGGSWLVTPLTQ